MNNEKIAVIGDKDVTLAFRALGMDVYHDMTHDDIKARIQMLEAEGCGIIFITDAVATQVYEFLKTYDAKPYPVIMSLPDIGGDKESYSIQKIFKNMERAVGSSAALK